MVWLWASYRDVHSSYEIHLAQRELLLGSPGEHGGIVQTLIWVNVILVIGSWIECRSAHRRACRNRQAVTLMALAGSIVLAAVAVSSFRLAEQYPQQEVRHVIELDSSERKRPPQR